MPSAIKSDLFSIKPGKCFAEHVGVKAPGTAKRAVFLFLNNVGDDTYSGPSLDMIPS